MKNLRLISRIAFSAAVVLCMGILAFYSSSIASAQRTVESNWEHCFVSYGSIVKEGNTEKYEAGATITYLSFGSVRSEVIKASGDDSTAITRNAFSQAVTRLGNSGWEMVTVGPSIFPDESTVLYFKRQRR